MMCGIILSVKNLTRVRKFFPCLHGNTYGSRRRLRRVSARTVENAGDKIRGYVTLASARRPSVTGDMLVITC
jgi:hypothetical protein